MALGRGISIGAVVFAAVAALAAPAAAKPVLQFADLRKLVSVGSPQFAPDVSRVAFTVARRDYTKNETIYDLVLLDLRTRGTRTLLHDFGGGGYAWAPDGAWIAYVSKATNPDDKGSQLFVLPMAGGEPVQITHEKNGVEDLAWRPDSKQIAYVAGGEAPNAKAIEAHDDAFNVTDEAWTAQAAPVAQVLKTVAPSGGAVRTIPNWTYFVAGGFTYTKDGGKLLVTRTQPNAHPNRYLASELVLVDVRSGATRVVNSSPGASNPMRSPDGGIAYEYGNPKGTMQTEIAIAGPEGDYPFTNSERLNRNVSLAGFSPHGVIALANDGTQRRIYDLHAPDAFSSYDIGTLSAFAVDAARDGSLVFVANDLARAGELYLLAPHATHPVRLTHYNDWLDAYALAAPQTVTWRTADGFHPDGVLLTPPNHVRGTKAPLVLLIHGGPTAATTTAFSGFAQVLAAHGWYVFEPNYRGSDNLGLAFAKTTVPHIASVPGDDIEGGISAVLKLSDADPARMAATGWSEGGLMTSWLIGHDTRFKAAVSGAAVNDWIGYSAMTDAKDFTPQFIGPSPWTNPALMSTFDSESPLTYAANVKTPTLILSDAGDFRVPTPLAYEFYHSVRATGTPVQFVIFPVNGHFPSDPIRSEDVYRRWEAWLLKYL